MQKTEQPQIPSNLQYCPYLVELIEFTQSAWYEHRDFFNHTPPVTKMPRIVLYSIGATANPSLDNW